MALRDISHRDASSVANGGIAEIDRPTPIAEGDARDPLQTCLNDLGIQPGGGRIIFTNSLPGSYQLLLFSRRARLDTGIGQAM
jgi:hypothetical protein